MDAMDLSCTRSPLRVEEGLCIAVGAQADEQACANWEGVKWNVQLWIDFSNLSIFLSISKQYSLYFGRAWIRYLKRGIDWDTGYPINIVLSLCLTEGAP